MNLKCLCCGEPVTASDVKLHYRVFVCGSCNEIADNYASNVLGDLRVLQASIVHSIRQGLLTGRLIESDVTSATVDERVKLLLRLAQESESIECSNQIRQMSSGETTKPSVSADGKRSLDSTNLPD